MKYALLIYETATELARRDSPDADRYWSEWTAYSGALAEAGVLVTGEGLEPPTTATTVRLPASGRLVQDGPYAASKEQLGGFYVIDVESLDVALEWAARMPTPGGAVEVRPTL